MREDHDDLRDRSADPENGNGTLSRGFSPPSYLLLCDPKISVRSQVNDITSMLRALVDRIEKAKGKLTDGELAMIETFLFAQLEKAMRDARLILASDPAAASHFSFDMELAVVPPHSIAQRQEASAPVVVTSRMPTPPVTFPGHRDFAKPTGRLVMEEGGGQNFADPLLTAPRPGASAPDVDDISFLSVD